MIVRFGNVLGSTGSVMPLFREQIARGGPVTVTHPDITRYFMSIPEAAQLVLQAALMGKRRRDLRARHGRAGQDRRPRARPDPAVGLLARRTSAIEFTGLRPGEKLYEEPLADDEKTLPTPHPKLRIARARPIEKGRLVEDIVGWLAAHSSRDAAQVREALRQWIPEYGPKARRVELVPPSPRPGQTARR